MSLPYKGTWYDSILSHRAGPVYLYVFIHGYVSCVPSTAFSELQVDLRPFPLDLHPLFTFFTSLTY